MNTRHGSEASLRVTVSPASTCAPCGIRAVELERPPVWTMGQIHTAEISRDFKKRESRRGRTHAHSHTEPSARTQTWFGPTCQQTAIFISTANTEHSPLKPRTRTLVTYSVVLCCCWCLLLMFLPCRWCYEVIFWVPWHVVVYWGKYLQWNIITEKHCLKTKIKNTLNKYTVFV